MYIIPAAQSLLSRPRGFFKDFRPLLGVRFLLAPPSPASSVLRSFDYDNTFGRRGSFCQTSRSGSAQPAASVATVFWQGSILQQTQGDDVRLMDSRRMGAMVCGIGAYNYMISASSAFGHKRKSFSSCKSERASMATKADAFYKSRQEVTTMVKAE